MLFPPSCTASGFSHTSVSWIFQFSPPGPHTLPASGAGSSETWTSCTARELLFSLTQASPLCSSTRVVLSLETLSGS